MTYIFNNRALSHITQGISSGDTQIRVPWPDFPMFTRSGSQDYMLVVLRGPTDREIVKIDIAASVDDEVDKYLTVERGQGGTGSAAWPAGTLIFLSTTADHYEAILQRPDIRQVDYNPNAVLSPRFQGEKILQYSGCEIRWWMSFNDTDPYWHLIAGDPCVDEEFVDPGFGFKVWMVFIVGDFFFRDVDNTYHTYLNAIHHTGSIVCVTGGFPDILMSYSIDGSGNLTYIARGDGSYFGQPVALASNGTHCLVGFNNAGIQSFEVTGAGAITYKDEDLAGTFEVCYGIVWTGSYFVACAQAGGDQKIASFTVDGAGTITQIDEIPVQGPFKIHWDGNFLYVASTDFYTGNSAGLYVFSIDGGGILTQIDYHNTGGVFGPDYIDVYSDGTNVYCISGNLLLVYDVDGAGNLTYRVSQNIGEAGWSVWKFGDFIVVGTQYGGMYSYEYDGAGSPPVEKDEEDNPPLAWPGKIRDNGSFLLVPSRSAFHGFKTYELV